MPRISRIFTESGAVYYYDEEKLRVMRRQSEPELEKQLRRDDNWIQLQRKLEGIRCGQPMILFLEQLNPYFPGNGFTVRRTTPVIDIDDFEMEALNE